MLLQAFWPVAAAAGMAHARGGLTLELCTAQGLVEISAEALAAGQKPLPVSTHHLQHCHFCCQNLHLSGILPADLIAASYLTPEKPAAAIVTPPALLLFGAISPPRGPPAFA